MKINNGTISAEISKHGAELKSVVKNQREYMWYADEKYWGKTSPILFPVVGLLKNKQFTHKGKTYNMNQHGFARDFDFELANSTADSLTYVLKSNEETLLQYPFEFSLTIKYTLIGSSIKVEWNVKNESNEVMSFSIGAHPAFNLKDGDNYFKFDNTNDLIYNQIDENNLYSKESVHILKNDGYVKYDNSMFDNDPLIFDNNQIKEVSLCDSQKIPYVTVKFDMPLLGLWTPSKKNAPFVCIEPWFGRSDSSDFCGDLMQRECAITLDKGKSFDASYEIEFI